MHHSNRSKTSYSAIFAAFAVFMLAACQEAQPFDEPGTLVQALSDGGDDMAGSPRIKPVYMKVNGATLAGAVGFYDTTLFTKCRPMHTSESNKIRCIPEVPTMSPPYDWTDFGDVGMFGTYFMDSTCSSDSYSYARPGTNAAKYVGRYAVVKEKIPSTEGVGAQYWVSRVYRVVGKVARPTGFMSIVDPYSGACRQQFDLSRPEQFMGMEFYKAAPVALSTFAEMTETD